jgi:hypothetical protein
METLYNRNQMMIDKVRSAVLDNQRITIRDLSEEVGLPFGSEHSNVTKDLGTTGISVKSVPKLPTAKQKETRSPCSSWGFAAVF